VQAVLTAGEVWGLFIRGGGGMDDTPNIKIIHQIEPGNQRKKAIPLQETALKPRAIFILTIITL
jgi:hypothetical protein